MVTKILVSIDDKLLKEVDKKVENIGYGANRSQFISKALKDKLGKKMKKTILPPTKRDYLKETIKDIKIQIQNNQSEVARRIVLIGKLQARKRKLESKL